MAFEGAKSFANGKADFAVEPVAVDKRVGGFNQGLVWAGWAIVAVALLTGSQIGAGLAIGKALLATLVGCVILIGLIVFCGSIGQRTGLTASVLSRHTFGVKGSALPSILMAIAYVGWNAVNVSLLTVLLTAMFPTLPWTPTAIVVGIVILTPGLIGFSGLVWVARISVPVLLLLGIVIWVRATSYAGGLVPLWSTQPTVPTITFSTAISMTIGLWILGTVSSADIGRYAKSVKAIVIAATVGFFLADFLYQFSGTVLTAATGTTDMVAGLLALGLGWLSVVVLMIGYLTTADVSLYSASLGFTNAAWALGWKANRFWIACVSAVIMIIGGVLHAVNYVIPFLSNLGIFLGPLGGIFIVDYWIVRRQRAYPPLEAINRQAMPAGILAYIVTGSIGWVLWRNGLGITGLNEIVLGGIAYSVFYKVFAAQRAREPVGELEEAT